MTAPSATHFIESVRVENGTPQQGTCECSFVKPGGTYNLLCDTRDTNAVWFERAKVFDENNFRLKLLEKFKIVEKTCTGCGDFTWNRIRTPEPINVPAQIKVDSWKAVDYTTDKSAGAWSLSRDGYSVNQTKDGQPAFYINGTDQIDMNFESKMITSAPGDNDYIGIVFGLQLDQTTGRPNNYYLLQWRRNSQISDGVTAPKGARLLRVTNTGRQSAQEMSRRLWEGVTWNPGTGAKIQVLTQNTSLPWEDHTEYELRACHRSDGAVLISITRVNDGLVLWRVAMRDPTPLPAGKVGFYNFNQPNVSYKAGILVAPSFVYFSPPGNICVNKKDGLYINGRSDDFVVLVHADDEVIEEYSGLAGDPVTITLPKNYIILRDDYGFFVGTTTVDYNHPRTAAKTFKDLNGKSYTFPAGTSFNIGTGHVSDMASGGFSTLKWGSFVSRATLEANKWLDPDGTFRFKFLFIPAGQGHVFVTGMQCVGADIAPPPLTYNWEVVGVQDNAIVKLADAPTVEGQEISLHTTTRGPIGLRLLSTPRTILWPKFALTEPEISFEGQPKEIRFTQDNQTLRAHSYGYQVVVDNRVYDTSNPDDLKYFMRDDQIFPLDNMVVDPNARSTVRFLIPFLPIATTATVYIYVDGIEENPTVLTLPITPRYFVQQPLVMNRELLSPLDDELTVRKLAYRSRIKRLDDYLAFRFANQSLSPVGWDVPLNNREVVVFVNAEVANLQLVLISLLRDSSILPNRAPAGL
jgi:hypothetical protein